MEYIRAKALGEVVVKFGPSHIEVVRDSDINEIPQIRREYNPEALAELADAMVAPNADTSSEPSDDTFDVVNALLIGRHDRASARLYINEHADFNRISSKDRITPSDLIWNEKRTLLLIAGHRRRRSIDILGERYGIPQEDREIVADVRQNITFNEGLALQARENIYSRPPAHDEARVIGQLYRHLTDHSTGQKPTVREIAKVLGYGETKVRDAIAFDSLPQSVQAYTISGLLPYTTVKQLKPLAEAFSDLYRDLPGEERYLNMTHELEIFCNQMVNMQLSGSIEQRRAQLIENRLLEVRGQAEYQQVELFFLEGVSPVERHRESTGQLAGLAIKVLMHQLEARQLEPKQLSRIEALVEEARAAAIAREAYQLDMPDTRLPLSNAKK